VRQRTGLRTSHHAVRRHGAGSTLFYRGIIARLPTRPFSRASLSASVGYSRPSGLVCMPHQDPFGPDATPTLGLAGSSRSTTAFVLAAAKCGRPTGFRGPPLLPGFSGSITFPLSVNSRRRPGVRAGPWQLRRCTQLFQLRPSVWRPPSASHQPAYAHLSERCLARVNYSCRRSSSVSSKARGATPDFDHPSFPRPGLPPRRCSDRAAYFIDLVRLTR